jgi:ribonuclease HI
MICTDALKQGLGVVLMQDGGVIVYASRNLKQEDRYTTQYLELTAVMLALKLWRHYLVGRSFELKTDHEILNHLFT